MNTSVKTKINKLLLLMPPGVVMASAWLSKHGYSPELIRNYKESTTYVTSSFLPLDLGMTQISHKNFSLKVSSTVRAMMECLYLAPQRMELMECFELMQGLTDLIPHKVEELLERCTSIKVKRLFLYLAEKSNHSWFKYLKLDHIDLGTGTRSLVKGGIYIPKYQITVPKEIEKK